MNSIHVFCEYIIKKFTARNPIMYFTLPSFSIFNNNKRDNRLKNRRNEYCRASCENHTKVRFIDAKKADINSDNKVDVLDFNSVIVNWGSAGGSGDLTGDGKVDILDFNFLMVNWSK